MINKTAGLLFLLGATTILFACGEPKTAQKSCSNKGDCLANELCINNTCQTSKQSSNECFTDDDCDSGLWCADNICSLSKDIACQADEDCPTDSRCDLTNQTCSLPPGNTNPPKKVCEPGATQQCVCTNQNKGSQTCAKSGESWEQCICKTKPTNSCRSDNDCKSSQRCDTRDSKCVDKPNNNCQKNSDCRPGFGCHPEKNECIQLPTAVRIRIENLFIAPGKINGEPWDNELWSDGPPKELLKKLADILLKKNPYTALVGLLADPFFKSTDPPDAVGTVEIISGASAQKINIPQINNQYNPSYTDLGWDNVPFNKDLRIRVVVEDSDNFNSNDGIGSAIINYDHMLESYLRGIVNQVKVGEQTKNQLLLIGISINKQK